MTRFLTGIAGRITGFDRALARDGAGTRKNRFE
jgi:hypothetical protein